MIYFYFKNGKSQFFPTLTPSYLVVAEITSSTLVEYVWKIKFKPNSIEYEDKFSQKKEGKKIQKQLTPYSIIFGR